MNIKEKNRQNKGITLIALVITIIVMLILVGVSISMAVNGGLFNYAGKAVGDTQNAIDAEKELANGSVEIGGVLYNSIDDYLKGKPAAVHNWTRTGDTFTCSHCNKTYTMGQEVNYTAAGVASTTLSATKSGLDKYKEKNSSYPTEAGNIGTDGTQTIEAQSAKWIVLGVEDTDKDGVNETLLITTSKPVSATSDSNLCFYGAASYNNGPEEINRICRELYSNSEYGQARGMTIEDVNNALGYEKKGGMYYDTEGNWKYIEGFETKMGDVPGFKEAVQQTKYDKTPDGTDILEYYNDGYYYFLNEDGTTMIDEAGNNLGAVNTKGKSIVFGDDISYVYYLASRGSVAIAGYGGAGFGSGYVDEGIAYSCDVFFNSDGNANGYEASLRPVVSLISNIPTGK